jgi:hypothetical protein
MQKNCFPNMQLPQDLVYEFLGTFARCEYALKGAGFFKDGKAEADWECFANIIKTEFDNAKDNEFLDAVKYILAQPPRKQAIVDQKLTWKDSPPSITLSKVEQVFLMVRRVRNNLFHGAKIWSSEYGNRERDIQLVKVSLVVLKQCILLNQDVRAAYDAGAF